MPKIIAVAFDLNQQQSAELFSGVSHYVRTHSLAWQLLPLGYGFEARLMQLAESGKLDGVIGTFVSDGWVQSLLKTRVVAVNVFNFSKIESIPSIVVDDFQIGQDAAQHLQLQGAEKLLFYGSDGVRSTRLRASGFASTALDPIVEMGPNTNLKETLTALSRDNQRLGVFCTSDKLARKFIQTAQQIGLLIPKDFFIIGVDNDPAESIFAGVELSSFHLPIEAVGAKAAESLQAQISNPKLEPTVSIVSEHKLIVRASSLASIGARVVQKAVLYMESHMAEGDLSVDRISEQIGASRRSLELHFNQHLETSPYQFLSQIRLKQAEAHLRKTTLAIQEVGRLCGYPEPHHFSIWFKKQNGLAPKNYRKSQADAIKAAV